ncbi:hypothetical protein HDE79_001060 [Rhodanobacter sp. MP1X3]|jgi:hypothetical protein|nr:hypothetical protein [Rhodanobacter sp. MP1X3]
MKLGMENRNQETQRKLCQHLPAFSTPRRATLGGSLFHLPRTAGAIA